MHSWPSNCQLPLYASISPWPLERASPLTSLWKYSHSKRPEQLTLRTYFFAERIEGAKGVRPKGLKPLVGWGKDSMFFLLLNASHQIVQQIVASMCRQTED